MLEVPEAQHENKKTINESPIVMSVIVSWNLKKLVENFKMKTINNSLNFKKSILENKNETNNKSPIIMSINMCWNIWRKTNNFKTKMIKFCLDFKKIAVFVNKKNDEKKHKLEKCKS